MPDNAIVEWLSDANSCFLLGAGCSAVAGKPLMDVLTKQVLMELSEPASSLFAKLEGANGRKATVEDLLNQLLQIRRLLSTRKEKKEGDWDLASADGAAAVQAD